jgi:type II secretory pathway pseudopilin PulG
MGRLKKKISYKLKASSLTEVIVATTILLIVFAIALVTLNNMMVSSMRKDTQNLDTELEKFIYQYQNKQLKIPLSYQQEAYIVKIQKMIQNDIKCIEFSIKDTNKGKTKTKRIIANTNEE